MTKIQTPKSRPATNRHTLIDDLDFGNTQDVRVKNCLRNAGILTVGQLSARSDAELLAIDNFGRGALNAVRGTLVREVLDSQADETLPAQQSCGTCAHVFEVTGADTPSGFCRRYPPSLKVDGNSSAFVPVKLEWRCGEWSKST